MGVEKKKNHKNKAAPRAIPKNAINQRNISIGNPVIIPEQIFRNLLNYFDGVVPEHRNVALTVKEYPVASINDMVGKTRSDPTHLVVFCVRVIASDKYNTLGVVHMNKRFEHSVQLTLLWIAFVQDLSKLGLNVVASVSPCTQMYRDILCLLTRNDKLEKSSQPITYMVYPYLILHLYDFNSIMEEFQEAFHFRKDLCFISRHWADTDEDMEDFQNIVLRRPYTVRRRPDHVNFWDDEDFIIRFRFSKDCVNRILEQIQQFLVYPIQRNLTLSPLQQLLLSLRYYASGSMLVSVGDFVGVHKTTVSRIMKRVTRAICSLRDNYIALPAGQEVEEIQQGFYNIASFPRVLLAIDGTHIRIQSPGGDLAEQFRNRKGYFSLNVLVACDYKMRFRNIVARWPGASNDINVFDNSYLKARFEEGMGNSLILGDSGYATSKYLMTPLQNPATPIQQLYNESQIRTRNKIECSIGIWKRRFPVLAIGMKIKIETVQRVILATAILHNIARDNNEPNIEVNEEIQEMIDEAVPENQNNIDDGIHQNNNWYRTELINQYFSRLL